MKKYYFSIIIIVSVLLIGGFVFSQDLSNISFPVAELDNCQNKEECKTYCDQPENMEVCLDFAEKHDLVPKEDINMGRKMLEAGLTGGPGGCQGQTECKTYCDVPGHMEECIIFALEHDLMPPEEREEAEMALNAIRQGAIPPPCQGKQECDEYCSEEEHLEECITFGLAAGFITEEEAEMIRKTGGKGPGGCKGKEECDAFCENPDNMEECLVFAIEYDLMPPEDSEEDIQGMLRAIRAGVPPPDCRSKEECDVYCAKPENTEECKRFFIAAGFMTEEEAEQMMKMMKSGLTGSPGGCKGKQECEEFCDNPDNMKECIKFSVKAGFMTEEEAEQALKMAELGITGGPGGCQSEQECKAFCDNPDNMDECIEFSVKAGFMTEQEARQSKQMKNLGMEAGPGGCKNQKECESYCAHPKNERECREFGEKMGLIEPGGPGPGMLEGPKERPGNCQTLEECKKYCQLNPRICNEMDFSPDRDFEDTGDSGRREIPLGPGGCNSPESCHSYCTQRPEDEECKRFYSGETMPSELPSGEMMPPSPEEMEQMKAYCLENPDDEKCQMIPMPDQMPPPEEMEPEIKPPDNVEEFIQDMTEILEPPQPDQTPDQTMPVPETQKEESSSNQEIAPPSTTTPAEEASQTLLDLTKKFLAAIFTFF